MNNKIKTNYPWLYDLPELVDDFLESLKKPNTDYSFFPARKGLTEHGSKLDLGFSCYGLKLKHITNKYNNLNTNEKDSWIKYINSFQTSDSKYMENLYIYPEYIIAINKFNIVSSSKYMVKKLMTNLKIKQYEKLDDFVIRSLRAETKQAIVTVKEAGYNSEFIYRDMIDKDGFIINFLKKQNWQSPWMAGAQFANMCLFLSQLQDEIVKNHINDMIKFIDELCDPLTGSYFVKPKPSNRELINGSMKVISGFDWIGKKINNPERLIDLCLSSNISHDGCDLVDVVYVLFKCSNQTSYKRSEISKYIYDLLEIISLHFYENDGGFSYFLGKSQTDYYGVKITNGTNNPDIHGTLLLTWALSMIVKMLEIENINLNILKP